jgi:hypothetical protein
MREHRNEILMFLSVVIFSIIFLLVVLLVPDSPIADIMGMRGIDAFMIIGIFIVLEFLV